jgi:hypothetical protein
LSAALSPIELKNKKIAQKPFKSFLGFHRQRMRKTTETLFIQTHLALALPPASGGFDSSSRANQVEKRDPTIIPITRQTMKLLNSTLKKKS